MRLRPDLSNLSELRGVRLLWVSDFWDGPTAGMATYDGREYWFAAVWDEEADDFTNRPRRYLLRELTDDQHAAEWQLHRSFAANVGGPGAGCLHEPPCPTRPLAGTDEVQAWYEQHPPDRRPDHADAPIVGWFTWSSTPQPLP